MFNIAANKINHILNLEHLKETPSYNEKKLYDVFIDFGGGKYEYQREYALWIKDELSQYKIKVEISNRYNNMAIENRKKGLYDIENLLASKCYVF